MRGKQPVETESEGEDRLIPAGAGKTRPMARTVIPVSAHPRRCGENIISGIALQVVTGSSPQVRGKLSFTLHHGRHRGLIPAGAGKTGPSVAAICPNAAHPRRCGENDAVAALGGGAVGSSPQVRGKPSRSRRRETRSRLIPAGAGKTIGVSFPDSFSTAHPRRCGENPGCIKDTKCVYGSSPQVRGKL